MRFRAHILLAAGILTLLCLPAPACSHDDGAKSGGEVDWGSFTSVAPPGETALNIGDVQKEKGLPLLLPSYLPEGMSKSLLVSVSEDDIGNAHHVRARVTLFPARREGLRIFIDESSREPGVPRRVYAPSSQFAKIGQTDVACLVRPNEILRLGTSPSAEPTEDMERYPWFLCSWDTDELAFDVSFQWGSPEPVPDQMAPEKREEAMRIIASMIEDPYIPGSSSP
jgi:hypothetical protein